VHDGKHGCLDTGFIDKHLSLFISIYAIYQLGLILRLFAKLPCATVLPLIPVL